MFDGSGLMSNGDQKTSNVQRPTSKFQTQNPVACNSLQMAAIRLSGFEIRCSAFNVGRWLPAQYSWVAIRAFFITFRAPYGKDGLD